MSKVGKIVLVPFPFTDLSGEKVRPALVLADDDKDADFLVCFITTVVSKKEKYGVVISKEDIHFKKTGLKATSVIRVSKIATLDKKVALGEIGELDIKKIQQVRKALREYLQV
ncbi:MAG: type II toxin-antitoxin system PemK/MazF family toxin [bacterium]